MNNEKGVTLSSLVIYVIVFSLILGLLVPMSSYMYSNINKVSSDSYSSEEFNKFNINFIKDVKENEDARVEAGNGNNVKIIFSNGVNYSYISSEKAIYRDKVKIAEKISTFTAEKIVENKTIDKNVLVIRIGTGVNDTDFGKTIKYVLKYW